MTDITKKSISLPTKEFIGICLFLITIGISIGGFIKVISDFDKVEIKIDHLSDKLDELNKQSSELKGIVSQLKK